VGVEDIYIDVNILEEIASQQWLEIAELQSLTPEEFDRFGLGEVSQKQISGMRAAETHSKLRVLGKPGSGKTTFLQHLTIECNQGKFAANRVPIFITLRDLADESREAGHSSLLNYIREEFLTSAISDPSVIETLLREGRVLRLLDGLDEVRRSDSNAVVKEIRRFSKNYQSADSLVQLMKQQVDGLVAQDPYLQEFLTWASQKSQVVPPQPSAIRAFYFALARTPQLAPHVAVACTVDGGIFLDAALNDLVLQSAIASSSDFAHAYACADALSNALTIVLDLGLQQSLQQLQDQLPDPKRDRERFQEWWQTNHVAWSERLRGAIALHRNIQHQWHFSPEQQQVLQRYYDANQLLIDCLNSNCEVTAAVRQEIEAALLLPQKELEEREWQ
jgi:predicted NACHT family NTPase